MTAASFRSRFQNRPWQRGVWLCEMVEESYFSTIEGFGLALLALEEISGSGEVFEYGFGLKERLKSNRGQASQVDGGGEVGRALECLKRDERRIQVTGASRSLNLSRAGCDQCKEERGPY